ncbi:MAG: O-antigen ligase family protein [bacterium]|nr:O-antigen ligase family protein [bacterium]
MKSLNNRYNIFYTALIFITGTLIFPLFFFAPYSNFKTVLILFSLSSISSLCLGIVLLKLYEFRVIFFKNKILSLVLILFLFIPIIHFLIYRSYTYNEWSFSILWISIPVFAYLFYNNLKILLPVYLFCFWIIDIIYSTFQKSQVVGIVGNRNWHAVFLIVLICFSLYFFYSFYKKTDRVFIKRIISIFSFILTLYTIYIIYLCESRGAWISLAITLFVFGIIKIYNHNLNRYIKYVITAISIFIIIAALFVFVFQLTSSSKLSSGLKHNDVLKNTALQLQNINNSLDNDVRTPLWIGCIRLIKDHPLIGVGTARFESVFAMYRPISYFAKPLSAVRSNHPHNTLLYITACYGIIGLALWMFLWLYPVLLCIIKYPQLTSFKKVTLFSYLCLFIHGMLDLIFFEWPTLFIAGILIGILWTEAWKPIQQNIKYSQKQTNIYLSILTKTVALILLAMTVKTVYNEYMSTYYFRQGRIVQARYNKSYEALYFYNKGLEYNINPKYLYKAATTSLLKLHDPMLALKYLNDFSNISTFDYAHKNSFIALALIMLKKPRYALPYLINAVINYPLSTGNWFRLANMQRELGMTKASKLSYENMYKTISYKGLPRKSLKLLLTNPDYDSHPQKIPRNIINELNQKQMK